MKKKALFTMVALVFCLSIIGGLEIPHFSNTAEAAGIQLVKVRIETPAKTIDSTEVSIDGCTIKDSSGVDHVLTGPKAACALAAVAQQGGYSYTFDDYGWGLYLTGIDGVTSDASNFWLYRVNYMSPMWGMADYDMSNGDELLVSYGPWPDSPLRVAASSTQVNSGQTFTITSSYYDDSKGAFKPIGNAVVHLGTEILTTDAQGNLTTSLDHPGSFPLYIEKDGYVRSNGLSIEVPVGQAELQHAAQKALDNLRTKQAATGAIDNAGISAWSAVAFGSADIDSETVEKQGVSLVDYLRTYIPASNAKATDYSRQILAVLAVGQDPRNFGTDLISGLKGFHQNGQIGDTGLINDDIFAVLALSGAGEDVNQATIRDSIEYIVSHQKADGGFSYSLTGANDIDTTCAAIQALALARNKGYSGSADLDAALTAARGFLQAAQNEDGGFPYSASGTFTDSNIASTAWAVQALAALGEDVSAWKSGGGSTPYNFMLASQNADGSFGWTPGSAGQNLMTAYAVPALLGQKLPVVYNRVQCSGEAPGISLKRESVEWASYADYTARTLTVDFSIRNSEGAVKAENVRVVASDNTNAVVASTTLPLSLGSIDSGSSQLFSLRYLVPVGVTNYRSAIYAAAEDVCGNTYEYPGHWSTSG